MANPIGPLEPLFERRKSPLPLRARIEALFGLTVSDDLGALLDLRATHLARAESLGAWHFAESDLWLPGDDSPTEQLRWDGQGKAL